MDEGKQPTLLVKSTARGQAHLLAGVFFMCAMGLWMGGRATNLSLTPPAWALIVLGGLAIGVFGLRMAIPSTLTLDADGVTWRVTGLPARHLCWVDIDRFGVVPPRPPLVDPLIGYSFRPGRQLSPFIRPNWTGYDATLGSGWEIEPSALVETLERYLHAARSGGAAA